MSFIDRLISKRRDSKGLSLRIFTSGEHTIIQCRRMAENGFAPPPLGNFADISYLVEN